MIEKCSHRHFQCKLTFARSTNAQAIQSVQGIACQCYHPGLNDRRYTKVSQSWLDAICGSAKCARPIHGQCRKQEHANSIQSLQNAIIQVAMTVGTQWKKSSAIADCNARVAARPIQGQCSRLGNHMCFTITSMPRGASMVTRLGSVVPLESRGNSSVQSHK